MGDPHVTDFTLTDTSRTEITKIISKLKANKSAGHDGLPPKVIKKCCRELCTPLIIIINRSIREGVFPDMLKIAKVIPIYKKKDRLIPGNYRPVSLLSCFSKIIEKLFMHDSTLSS